MQVDGERLLVRTTRMIDGQKIEKREWIDGPALGNYRLMEELLPGQLLACEVIVSVQS
jgi:hypothetical protein